MAAKLKGRAKKCQGGILSGILIRDINRDMAGDTYGLFTASLINTSDKEAETDHT